MNSTLYQKIAEAVRTDPGSPELVKAIYDVVRDEVESLTSWLPTPATQLLTSIQLATPR